MLIRDATCRICLIADRMKVIGQVVSCPPLMQIFLWSCVPLDCSGSLSSRGMALIESVEDVSLFDEYLNHGLAAYQWQS